MTSEIKYKNKAKCRVCDTIIESKHVHDFVKCKCEAIFVDGGNEYHRGGGSPENFIFLYEPLISEPNRPDCPLAEVCPSGQCSTGQCLADFRK